jgi:hypothetical protein
MRHLVRADDVVHREEIFFSILAFLIIIPEMNQQTFFSNLIF